MNVDGDDDDGPLPGIKEESDDDDSSSESEGENDEEADMSEEISYFEPAQTGDMSSNSMVTMVTASSSSSSKKPSSMEDRISSPARGAPGGVDESSSSSYRNAETPPYHSSQSGADYLTANSESSYNNDTVHVDSISQNELPLETWWRLMTAGDGWRWMVAPDIVSTAGLPCE